MLGGGGWKKLAQGFSELKGWPPWQHGSMAACEQAGHAVQRYSSGKPARLRYRVETKDALGSGGPRVLRPGTTRTEMSYREIATTTVGGGLGAARDGIGRAGWGGGVGEKEQACARGGEEGGGRLSCLHPHAALVSTSPMSTARVRMLPCRYCTFCVPSLFSACGVALLSPVTADLQTAMEKNLHEQDAAQSIPRASHGPDKRVGLGCADPLRERGGDREEGGGGKSNRVVNFIVHSCSSRDRLLVR